VNPFCIKQLSDMHGVNLLCLLGEVVVPGSNTSLFCLRARHFGSAWLCMSGHSLVDSLLNDIQQPWPVLRAGIGMVQLTEMTKYTEALPPY
jgi:hypothetical protein